MLNLAFSTLPCDGWSVEKLLSYCKEYGYKGIEIREGPDSIVSTATQRAEISRVSRLFKEADVTITDIGSSVCITGQTTQAIQANLENLVQLSQLADQLGAGGIRVFLGNFARRRDDPKIELNYPLQIECLQKACDYALNLGVEIWVETHNEFSTGRVLRKLLEDVNRPNCRIIWDILHPLEDDEDPQDTIKYLGQQCAHLHIKDAVPYDDPLAHDWRYTWLGDGKIPVKEIITLVQAQGFEGFFSLEWETKWRVELQKPEFVPERILPFYPKYMKNLLA